MELEEGTFYQMSYDGTYVPIIADYPGLLPASHVSDPKTPYSKEISPSFLPTALSYAKRRRVWRAVPLQACLRRGRPLLWASLPRGKQTKTRTYLHRRGMIRQHAPEQSRPTVTFPFSTCQEKGAPDYIRRFERPYFLQPRFKSCCEDGGWCGGDAGLSYNRRLGRYIRHQLGSG